MSPQEQWAAFEHTRERMPRHARSRINTISSSAIVCTTGDIYPVDLELTIVMIFDHPKNTECMMFQRTYLDELLKAKNGKRSTTPSAHTRDARQICR